MSSTWPRTTTAFLPTVTASTNPRHYNRNMVSSFYCRHPAQRHSHAGEVEYVPIDHITWFPGAGELCLIKTEAGEAEQKIHVLEEIMYSAFLRGSVFVCLETGHGSHSEVESLVALLFKTE